jgi:hypothetical protein
VSRENVELVRRYHDAWNSGDTDVVRLRDLPSSERAE